MTTEERIRHLTTLLGKLESCSEPLHGGPIVTSDERQAVRESIIEPGVIDDGGSNVVEETSIP